jgi:hypothetical protein
MNTDNFRQLKEKPTPKDPAKDKKEGEEKVQKKEKPGKKRALGRGANKLPAVPESVLKSRKRRDLAKAARLKAALKVITVTHFTLLLIRQILYAESSSNYLILCCKVQLIFLLLYLLLHSGRIVKNVACGLVA